jgi:hypothetical protein
MNGIAAAWLPNVIFSRRPQPSSFVTGVSPGVSSHDLSAYAEHPQRPVTTQVVIAAAAVPIGIPISAPCNPGSSQLQRSPSIAAPM